MSNLFYRNPVYDRDAPDPTVIRTPDGVFHCFTTQSIYDGRLVNVPHLRSKDLVSWEFFGDAMPAPPAWTEGSIWAPHIDTIGDVYVMYYCAKVRGSEEHAIGVRTCTDLGGSFADKEIPLVSRTGHGDSAFSAIDPFSLLVEDGRRLLYWGSGHAPIRARELTPDGLDVKGPTHIVLRPFVSERGHGNLVEAAEVRFSPLDSRYYLWVSGDNTHQPRYAVSEFRSTWPDRGFQPNGNPANPILDDNETYAAPGHHCRIADDAGHWWVLYHANLRDDLAAFRGGPPVEFTSAGKPAVPRKLLLDRVELSAEGWSTINNGFGPSHERRPAPQVHSLGGR